MVAEWTAWLDAEIDKARGGSAAALKPRLLQRAKRDHDANNRHNNHSVSKRAANVVGLRISRSGPCFFCASRFGAPTDHNPNDDEDTDDKCDDYHAATLDRAKPGAA